MRPLTLHASALNDAEYQLYTHSLEELCWVDSEGGVEDIRRREHDDKYYEALRVGVREVRGWMRGRYANLMQGSSPGAIDLILRLFAPELRQTDLLSGGQFFAALRLVIHVGNGKEVDRALAFVQAHPASGRSPETILASPSTAPFTKRDASLPRVPLPQSPHPEQKSMIQPPPHSSYNPFLHQPQLAPPTQRSPHRPPLPPRKPTIPAASSPPDPQAHIQVLTPPPRHGSIGSNILPLNDPQSPFLTRARDAFVSSPEAAQAIPLPRHAPVLPKSSTKLGTKPTPLPKPTHITSTLMKQSLQASKAAQTMKRAEEELERERVLRVLKSSSNGAPVPSETFVASQRVSRSGVLVPPFPLSNTTSASDSSSGSASSKAPPLPRRRHTSAFARRNQQQTSSSSSVSSLAQVALASTESTSASQYPDAQPPISRNSANPFPNHAYSRSNEIDNNPFYRSQVDRPVTLKDSPQSSPTHGSIDLPPPPPPTHPDLHRKPKDSPFPFSAPNTSLFIPHRHESPFTTPPTAKITPASPVTPGNEASPTARVFRSKSLHSPPTVGSPFGHHLDPPPSRKRPESVSSSLLRGPIYGSTSSEERGGSIRQPASFSDTHHRRQSSLSSFTTARSQPTGDESPLEKLAKTFNPHLEKMEKGLERARYKAEAGLSPRRGYVRDSPSLGLRFPRENIESWNAAEMEREEKEDLIAGEKDSHAGFGHGEKALRGSKNLAHANSSGRWVGRLEDQNNYEPPSVDGDGESSDSGGLKRTGSVGLVGEGWRPLA